MKKKGKCMPGFPAHQGALFSAVQNTLFLKWERNKEGPNCWVCPIVTGQEIWEGMRFWLLMVCWEIISQRPTPCWSSESPANPSAIAPTLGNGEERFRGFGSMLKKARTDCRMAQMGPAGAWSAPSSAPQDRAGSLQPAAPQQLHPRGWRRSTGVQQLYSDIYELCP